jgi:signal transduction histidine kinase
VRRELPPLSPLQLVDVVSLTGAAAVSVALVYVFGVSPLVIGGALLAAVLIYPRWRRTATVGADRLLLSDVRERAAMEATEEERARFARDLHDSPLQQLAGVIQRLEAMPSASGETDTLRSVAQQLRAVATDLRPPVLDDLGLASALHFLADRATTDDVVVTATIDDRTGIMLEERAPGGVELAIYRIAEEAVNNALQHSRGTEIAIVGMVAANEVEVSISDNGVGLVSSAVDDAARAGRLGLVSMRRRASLIGADLSILAGAGTTVKLRWHA